MSDTIKNLGVVFLDLHTPAASIAELPPPQLGIDQLLAHW